MSEGSRQSQGRFNPRKSLNGIMVTYAPLSATALSIAAECA